MKIFTYLKVYLLNLIYVLGLVLNTIFLGDPDETMSSRMGKKAERGDCWLCKTLCGWIDKIDQRHCQDAIKRHEGRGSADDDSVMNR
jgi:hypothetical protein